MYYFPLNHPLFKPVAVAEADVKTDATENPVQIHGEPDAVEGNACVLGKTEQKPAGNEEAEKNAEDPHADVAYNHRKFCVARCAEDVWHSKGHGPEDNICYHTGADDSNGEDACLVRKIEGADQKGCEYKNKCGNASHANVGSPYQFAAVGFCLFLFICSDALTNNRNAAKTDCLGGNV